MSASETVHGSATGYRRGCRCGVCREGHRVRHREYAASKRAAGVPSVPKVPGVDVPVGGSVVEAVRRELAGLPVAAERPTTAAVCLALARLLDDTQAGPQHPTAAARLLEAMTALRAQAPRRVVPVRGLS